jgi:hypothetical protein
VEVIWCFLEKDEGRRIGMEKIIQLRKSGKLEKILVPACGFDPEKEGIVDDQGFCNMRDLLMHIKNCPVCLGNMILYSTSALCSLANEVNKK